MRLIIDFVYLLAGLAISPMVIYRMIRQGRYRKGWAQRFGKITRKHPEKKCIWLHAVSVGEVNATKTIVKELQNKLPSLEIVISTTTDTGFARANTLYGADLSVFYFPLDFSLVVRRAFANLRPAICLLMELEVWPNFVSTARRLNIPVVVVNGRITQRSVRRYGRIKPIAKAIFRKVTLVLAQTDEYAERFKEIGCPDERIIVTGSLKYDTAQVTDKVEGADALAARLNIQPDDTLWVAGGTGNDEEKILLDVYKELKQQNRFTDLRLAIVPRKPERFDEVAQLITDADFDLVRYSSVKDKDASTPHKAQAIRGDTTPCHSERSEAERRISRQAVILGDTMGDLRKFYSLAAVVFVGRSLVPMGGSDMIEVAALGKPTIFGPHAFNFQQTVDDLLKDGGAILVRNAQQLLDAMQKCLTEPDFARTIAENGRDVIRKNQGATKKTIDQIANILHKA
ncbi:MAG TPA: 3-deoxy-D-manno-octulosonic acid transferase [Sedimentisphaerales bacterium]|nr:3-deoxy-D-manno-octulosonic acid transferase [Sedimentisphaerales bacterium]